MATATTALMLIYGNRKEPDMKFEVSTPELRAKAFLELFKHLDGAWKVYSDWEEGVVGDLHKDLYKKAKGGDVNAAELLLTLRKDYEYEKWQIEEVATQSTDGFPQVQATRQDPKDRITEVRSMGSGTVQTFEVRMGHKTYDFAVVPMSAPREDMYHEVYVIGNFIRLAVEAAANREELTYRERDEMLSAIERLRITLWYTMHPETMPPVKPLDMWQGIAFRDADACLEHYAANKPKPLPKKKLRLTEVQELQKAVGDLVLHLNSAIKALQKGEKLSAHDLKVLVDVRNLYDPMKAE